MDTSSYSSSSLLSRSRNDLKNAALLSLQPQQEYAPLAFETATNLDPSFSSRSSLSSRRRGTLPDRPIVFGINPDFHFSKVSRAEAAMQHLDELSPMAGGFGRVFTKKQRENKKPREWNLDGRVKGVEVPIERFVRDRKVSCTAAEPRSRLHRLIYQKARYLREEHGSVYTGFQQVGRDMVRSVRICLQIVCNFDRLAKEPMHDKSENDEKALLDGASATEASSTRASVNDFPCEEKSVEEKWRELEEKYAPYARWKNILADVKLLGLIVSFLD